MLTDVEMGIIDGDNGEVLVYLPIAYLHFLF